LKRFSLNIPKPVIRLAQVAFAIGLLVLLWRAADGQAALTSLATADWRWLALAVLALSAQTVLSALRWRLTAAQLGIELGRRAAITEYYLSQVVNQSLPGGMIGDAGRAVRSREQAGLVAAGLAVALERLAGQVAMVAILGVSFFVTLAVPGGLDWPGWLAVPVAVLLVSCAVLPVLAYAARHLPGAAGVSVRRMLRPVHTALLARSVLPAQIVLSIGTAACNLLAFALCAHAVGVELGLAEVTALVPLILFAMLIPLTVSGWGLREGAAAVLLPVAGVAASGGLAASVAFGLAFLVAVLPGIFLHWLTPQAVGRESGQLQPEAESETIRRA
jgi:uncharacterized membrane protein YbhN (UPF0104 family)